MGSNMGTSIIAFHFRTYPKVDPGRRSIGSEDRTEQDGVSYPWYPSIEDEMVAMLDRVLAITPLRFIPSSPK